MKEPSLWLFGILYNNRRDPRLWVPPKWGLGWTLNFLHPSAEKALLWVLATTCGLPLAGLIIWRRQLLGEFPATWQWLLGPLAVALVAFVLNPLFWAPHKPRVSAIGWGVIAAGIGFAIQAVLNGPVVLWVGPRSLSWVHHLYLAGAAAAAQTAGKLLMLAACLRLSPPENDRDQLHRGLAIGLGFALLEILLIWSLGVTRGVPIRSLIGVGERGSAALFHIYSAGLLGLFLRTRQIRWLAAVWTVHALCDWLVGANATLLQWNLAALEATVAVLAVTIWVLFLISSRPGRQPPYAMNITVN